MIINPTSRILSDKKLTNIFINPTSRILCDNKLINMFISPTSRIWSYNRLTNICINPTSRISNDNKLMNIFINPTSKSFSSTPLPRKLSWRWSSWQLIPAYLVVPPENKTKCCIGRERALTACQHTLRRRGHHSARAKDEGVGVTKEWPI